MSLQDLWEMMSFGGNESRCSSGMSTHAMNINTAGRAHDLWEANG
jgi:hypothetical protein